MKEINYILDVMPHRYPFLMVDRILSHEKKTSIETLKNVSINEEFFQGHFPTKPIMPGVLILEAIAQSACLLMVDFMEDPSTKLVYMSKVVNYKMYQNVIPGDQLNINAKLLHQKMGSFKFEGTCFVKDKKVASAEFFATVVER
jgi:3-hydroxyacyl-[acyl-carrier-protein] dehydratase|tara:strand:- start:27 stop:458 length:432 start_codon:yes stop_codon:yes gene_type:complete